MKAATLKNVSHILYLIGFCLVGLGCFDFLSLQGYILACAAFVLVLSIIFSGKIIVVKELVLFSLFVFSYFLFTAINSRAFSLYECFYSLVLPLIVFLSVYQQRFDADSQKFAIFLPALGLGLVGVSSIVFTMFFTGRDMSQGVIFNLWTGNYYARTGTQVLITPLLGFFCGYCFAFDRRSKTSWLLLVSLAVYSCFVLYFSLIIANRAIFVVTCLLFLAVLLFAMRLIHSRAVKFSIWLCLFLAVLLFFGMYFQIIPIPDFLRNIPVVYRFLSGGSNSERVSLYVKFFSLAPFYLFGGMNSELTYVHNFVLDIYTYGGIVPLVLFLICLFQFAYNILSKDKKPFAKIPLIRELVFVFLAVFFLGMFEPLLNARPFYISYLGVFFAISASLNKSPFVLDSFRKRISL